MDDVAVFGVADIEDEAVGAEVEFEVIIAVEGGVEIGGELKAVARWVDREVEIGVVETRVEVVTALVVVKAVIGLDGAVAFKVVVE